MLELIVDEAGELRREHDGVVVDRQVAAKTRALGEQAIAHLKTWRLPRKLRYSTTRITDPVEAILTLHRAASG